MNVMVLYPSEIKNTFPLQIFEELKISCNSYEVKSNWEDNKKFLEMITQNKYFFIIAEKATIEKKWFKFVVGYCLGKECPLYLFLKNPLLNPPRYLKFVKYSNKIEDVRAFYRTEYEERKKKNEREQVITQITDQGLYLTPYHFFNTMEQKNKKAFLLYLKAGYDPNTVNKMGIPAFNYAVRLGYNELAMLLLDYQANPFVTAKDSGNNALMDAAANGNLEMAELLVNKGIELDIQSKNDQTALMLAVGRNDEPMVKLLLNAGAKTDIKDVLDMTAFKYAEILKYKNILKLLKKHG